MMRRTSRSAVITSLCLLSISVLAVSALIAQAQSVKAGGACTTTVSPGPGTPVQSAIDAASSGAVICLNAGNYPEQLSITTPLTLQGLGTGANATVIAPASVTADSNDPGTGNPEASIILVSGTTQVSITNLVIDGSLASSSINDGCAPPSFEGVLFSGASGALTDSRVTNFYQASPLDYGCQSNAGQAVVVQSPPGTTSTVSITGDTVTDYQKNGIACNDVGTSCNILSNAVSPLVAAADANAPNGIVIASGAVGAVGQNTVTGNECNLPAPVCGQNLIGEAQGVGIYTYGSGAGTVVQGNTIGGNDVGIVTFGDSATSTNNVLQGNRYEGIILNDGTYTCSGNTVSGSMIGVAVVSDGFVASPTSATLTGNDLAVSTSPVQVVAYYGGSYGGANVENASVSFGGALQTVAPGPSGAPSTVDVTPPTAPTQTTTTTTATTNATTTSTATTSSTPYIGPQCATALYDGYYTSSATGSVVTFTSVPYATAYALVAQNPPGAMSCELASATSQLTVDTEGQGGNAMTGYYAVLDQNGSAVAAGFSPTEFNVTSGQTYVVEVMDYGACHFGHWADTGSTDRQRTITASDTAQSLTAMYDCGAATAGSATINVSATNSTGGSIRGYYATLWQNGTQVESCFSPCSFTVSNGQTYQVAVAGYGSEVFSHWSDGTPGRFYTVDAPGSGSVVDLTAVFSP
jgi:hypothetical protein